MKARLLRLLVAICIGILPGFGARAEFPALALKPISLTQITSPVNISNAGDGSKRLFVCDQAGQILIIRDDMVLPVPFLDLSGKLVPKAPTTYLFPLSTSYDERGLLGLAFHPNFNKKDINNLPLPGFGMFYAFYSAPSPNSRGGSISSIAVGNPCTVTTTKPHGLTTGDAVTITSVSGGNFSPSINATYTVTVGGPSDFTVPVNCLDNTGVLVNNAKVFPLQPENCRTTISEFQISAGNPNVADPASERVVLSFDKPQSNHNGGQLQFGPDGFLYISIGDGGSQHDNDYGHTGGQMLNSATSVSSSLGNAQDKTKLLGKILRIDPLGTNGPGGQYGIPASNPFVGVGGGVREEIYAYGVRNPWRFSFDDGLGGTGRLFEGDVGQDTVEEVNIIVSGGNYGWRIKEGTFDHDSTAPNGGLPLIAPIAQYAHIGKVTGPPVLPQIGASVTGGYLYRGSAIPGLVGKYVFGDYSHGIGSANGTLLGLEETPPNSNNWALSLLPVAGGNPLTTRIYAFGRDEQGEIYVATKVTKGPFELDVNGKPTGGIYKIVVAQVSTATLNPSKDNTIFSELTSNSDAGGKLTSGRTNVGNLRRALLGFNVAGQLPAGAVVTSAQLTLNLNQTTATTNASMSLYRLSQDWGEGTSDPLGNAGGAGVAATVGDATWTARFYDPTSPTLWSTAGGSYNASSSSTATVGTTAGQYLWTSALLATDAQGWVNTPATNFGWVLVGDEVSNQSARRFDSREGAANVRPALALNYNPVLPPLTRRESWLRQYFPTPGTYVDDLADFNGDGLVSLVEYAFALSPLAANPPAAELQTSATPSGASTIFTVTFRRDPRATDLTYNLEASSDMATWSTIVQSAAGAIPTGSGYVSEAEAPGEAPVKIVTATETLPTPAKQFFRLRVIRAF